MNISNKRIISFDIGCTIILITTQENRFDQVKFQILRQEGCDKYKKQMYTAVAGNRQFDSKFGGQIAEIPPLGVDRKL
jgi:hypothetical protein